MSEPTQLYHYTSQNGILGILGANNSKPCLWMTDIQYLNDSSEYRHTLELVKPVVKEYIELLPPLNNPEDKIDKRRHEVFHKILNFCNFSRIYISNNHYVFALSEKSDDLSQWRSYCPQVGGFCIEFDYNKLCAIINGDDGYEIKKCEYNSKVKFDLVKKIILEIDAIACDLEKYGETILRTSSISRIGEIATYFKHDSFIMETEYRIIKWKSDIRYTGERYPKPFIETKYRIGKSTIIPYIEFSPLNEHGKLPISKIIIGPTPDPELSKMSIDNLLKSKGYDIEVYISKIPYRTW